MQATDWRARWKLLVGEHPEVVDEAKMVDEGRLPEAERARTPAHYRDAVEAVHVRLEAETDVRHRDVVLSRGTQGAVVTLPQRVVEHSPTGMEWGYSGSGPADLALNLHQQLKREMVAPMPREGGRIMMRQVREWVAEHAWWLQMPPQTYLVRYPEGEHADRAAHVLRRWLEMGRVEREQLDDEVLARVDAAVEDEDAEGEPEDDEEV